jgi:hypothetical protein
VTTFTIQISHSAICNSNSAEVALEEKKNIHSLTEVHIRITALQPPLLLPNYLFCAYVHMCHVSADRKVGPSPHLNTETDPVSLKLCFPVICNSGRWMKPRNSEILSVIQNRQNPACTTGMDFPLGNYLKKLRGLSPRANYTGRATTACRRS